MLSRLVGAFARRTLLPLGKALSSMGITPNMATVFGTLVVVVGCWLVAAGAYVGGGVIVLVGAAVDLLDGAIARGGGKATKAGAFLDSTLDRVSDGALFMAIAWSAAFPGSLGVSFGPDVAQKLPLSGALVAALALAAMLLGFMTSYIKARSEGIGIGCDVGIVERPERIGIACIGLISGLTSPAIVILVVLSAVTVVQRFRHTWLEAQKIN